MTERTKPVWVSPRIRHELLKRAGELQEKTGEKVTLGKVIEVALRLLDTEAATRLILEQRKAGSDPTRKEPASDPLEVATA